FAVACSSAQDGKTFDRGAGPPKPPAPLVRLARAGTGKCPARCPTYSVEIDAEGDLSYAGIVNVKTTGPAAGHLGAEALAQLHTLLGKARQAKFPKERCACGCVADTPVVTLTTWLKSAATTVTYEEGCERVPHPVRVLEEGVDDLVNIDR